MRRRGFKVETVEVAVSGGDAVALDRAERGGERGGDREEKTIDGAAEETDGPGMSAIATGRPTV